VKDKGLGTFLIVNGDDFGCSPEINRAIEQAALEGILTSTSLMMNGEAVDDAIRIAHKIPGLQVALHLTLTEGRPISQKITAPALLSSNGRLNASPTKVGFALQFSKEALRQIDEEVAGQFRAFSETNLPFLHVDSHHHIHAHPKLFDMVVKNAIRYKLKSIRIPYEPWDISGPISRGHTVRNAFYRNVFGKLSARGKKKIQTAGLASSDAVFGLYQTGEVTEDWMLLLLDRLRGRSGTFELYTHPSDAPGTPAHQELRALMSPKVRKKIEKTGTKLIRHMDMAG
jgi:hopanoid biosynthesis associated protein HpnK